MIIFESTHVSESMKMKTFLRSTPVYVFELISQHTAQMGARKCHICLCFLIESTLLTLIAIRRKERSK